jgi:hypothetical protein
MRLLDFENFKKLESIKESEEQIEMSIDEAASMWDGEQILNESFSSSIMKTLVDSDPKGNRWEKGFASDMYKTYKIAISDIQDTDFQLLTDPALAFQRPIKGDDNKIVFFINDDTELRDKWSIYQKGRAPFPFMVSIVQGGVGLWYGLRKAPSKSFRGSQSKEDRYGVLAKEWVAANYFGSGTKNSVTQTSIADLSTKAYVLDLASIREKYSATPKQAERVESRKGALALISARQVKADNIQRYKTILSEKVGPADTLAKFQAIWAKASVGISDWVSSTKLDDLDVVKNYGSFEFGGWHNNEIGQTMSQLYRTYGDYIRDYVDFARAVRRTEAIATAIEEGKDTETGTELSPENIEKMKGTLKYLEESNQSKMVKFVEYNHHFDKCDKEITAGIEKLNSLLGADKTKFDLGW